MTAKSVLVRPGTLASTCLPPCYDTGEDCASTRKLAASLHHLVFNQIVAKPKLCSSKLNIFG